MKEETIKSCPFCGGEAELQHVGAQASRYCVKCTKCWAKSIYVGYEEQKTAIEKWNKRK